jgi:hypothetical protein
MKRLYKTSLSQTHGISLSQVYRIVGNRAWKEN